MSYKMQGPMCEGMPHHYTKSRTKISAQGIYNFINL